MGTTWKTHFRTSVTDPPQPPFYGKTIPKSHFRSGKKGFGSGVEMAHGWPVLPAAALHLGHRLTRTNVPGPGTVQAQNTTPVTAQDTPGTTPHPVFTAA